MKWIGYLLIAMGLCLTIAQVIVYGGQLPDKVASHFNAAGAADGWMSRTGFLVFLVAFQFGLCGCLLLIGWGLSRLPVSMINIPHRDYWLDDIRRESTLRINRDMLALISGLTALFLVAIFQMTIQANLQIEEAALNGWFWGITGAYMVGVLSCAGWLVWRFARIPPDAG